MYSRITVSANVEGNRGYDLETCRFNYRKVSRTITTSSLRRASKPPPPAPRLLATARRYDLAVRLAVVSVLAVVSFVGHHEQVGANARPSGVGRHSSASLAHPSTQRHRRREQTSGNGGGGGRGARSRFRGGGGVGGGGFAFGHSGHPTVEGRGHLAGQASDFEEFDESLVDVEVAFRRRFDVAAVLRGTASYYVRRRVRGWLGRRTMDGERLFAYISSWLEGRCFVVWIEGYFVSSVRSRLYLFSKDVLLIIGWTFTVCMR